MKISVCFPIFLFFSSCVLFSSLFGQSLSREGCYAKCWEMYDYSDDNMDCQAECARGIEPTLSHIVEHVAQKKPAAQGQQTGCFDRCWDKHGSGPDNLACQLNCPDFGKRELAAAETMRDIDI